MPEKYQSGLLQSIYEEAKALYDIGAISGAEMREYETGCLVHKAGPDARPRSVQSGGKRAAVPAYAASGAGLCPRPGA